MRSVSNTRSLVRLSAALSLAIVATAARSADAHYILNAPTSWWTQTPGAGGGFPQKDAPCGNEVVAGTSATGTVNVYTPGQPVTLSMTSTVDHPGWWRVSLREGRVSTQTVAAFPDPTPLGASGSALQCTPAFIDNPVWSTTQPVIADKLGLPPGSTATNVFQRGTQTYTVMIPANARCSNASPCTLQVLMIMTDHPAGNCNYHHCADMAATGGTTTDAGTDVRAGTGGTTGGTGGTVGGTGGRDAGATTGNGGSNGAGGSTSAGAGGTTGSATGGATGSSGTGGSTGSTGAGGNTATADAGTTTPATNDSGCGCATGRSGTPITGLATAGLLIVGLILRRKRHG